MQQQQRVIRYNPPHVPPELRFIEQVDDRPRGSQLQQPDQWDQWGDQDPPAN